MNKMLTLFLLLVFFVENHAVTSQNDLDRLFQELHIPSDVKGVLIFGQGSHLDWDWLNVFSTNVNNTPGDISGINYWVKGVREPSDDIFQLATSYLSTSDDYRYSIAEMGFLRAFQQDWPQKFQQFVPLGRRLSIVGGGITTPDSLLSHGEAFIRNYLVGLNWLNSSGIAWTRTAWVIDDFGHDSQLPVVLQALGVTGVGFARLPGSCYQGSNNGPNGYLSAHEILLNQKDGGLDFEWVANDGSSVLSFYEPTHYDTGDRVGEQSSPEYNSVSDALHCRKSTTVYTTQERFQCYLNVRQPVSRTPMIFVTTGSDFAPPVPNLLAAVEDWNNNSFPKTGIYSVLASFGHYEELVTAWLNQNHKSLPLRNFHGNTNQTSFVPTPYWMGFYASRPSLKIFHYQATRLLLSSEILNVMTSSLGVFSGITQNSIDLIWNDHVPSTHHDYVTGTSTDAVLSLEQYPLSNNVYKRAYSTRWTLLQSLVNNFGSVSANVSNDSMVLVFNPHSFPVSGVTVIQSNGITPSSVPQTIDGQTIYGEAPPFGYQLQRNNGLSSIVSSVKLTMISEDSYVLENGLLSARISKSANWTITNFIDIKSGSSQSLLSIGNILEFRTDQGNIYRFGFEELCPFNAIAISNDPLPATVVENTPLKVTVRTPVHVKSSLFDTTYTMEYTLVAEEPFFRIKLTGFAPLFTTIFTRFQFPTRITRYEHGTPYHWDYKHPFPYGNQYDFRITFDAVHDYIIPSTNDTVLSAFYHSATPAWGVKDSSIYAVVLRNSPGSCASKGASGSDDNIYDIHYAIRVPTGLGPASSGQPLRESRVYHTPLVGVGVDNLKSRFSLPTQFSLLGLTSGSVSPPSLVITALKRGSKDASKTFLRLYNPQNSPSLAYLTFNESLNVQSVYMTTALEEISTTIQQRQPYRRIQEGLVTSFEIVADLALKTLLLQ